MTPYELAVRNARIYEVELLVSLEKRMSKVLGDAYTALDTILQKSAGSNDTIKSSRTVALQREIKQIMGDTADKISDTVKDGITAGVNIVVDSRVEGGVSVLKDINPLLAGKIPSSFAHVRVDAVKAVLNRKLPDGKMFSDRIWDLKNHSGNVISDVVARGITIGQSARDMAKEIEPYLKGYKELKEAYKGDEDFQTAWKTLRRKRGDLRYDSMRLASTEINHAEREATIQSAERAPWVLGIKWNLSLSHPKIDICDSYAERDLYGLGRGVYPPRDVPLDHPNGMCFLTDVLMPLENLKGVLAEEPIPEKPVSGMTPAELRGNIISITEKDNKEIERLRIESQTQVNIFSQKLSNGANPMSDEMKGISKMASDLLNDARDIKEKTLGKIHNEIYANKKGISIDNIHNFDSQQLSIKERKAILNDYKDATKFVNTELLENNHPVIHISFDFDRASYKNGAIQISRERDNDAIMHELGHHLEDTNKEIHGIILGFYKKRTENEIAARLSDIIGNPNFGNTEFTKKDKFIDPYMGKVMSGLEHTEILSMGMTMLKKEPLKLAREDPEYFDLIIGILHKL